MIRHTTSASSIIPCATRPLLRLLRCSGVIPSVVGPRPRHARSLSVISSEARNLSYGLSSGFSAGRVDFADGAGFGAAGFPTVKYLRIFSSRFGPSPRIASKSSTLLNAPYDLRICRIFSAVAGPIPGTCCSSSDVAVLRFIGRAGGFFFPASTEAEVIRPRKRIEERRRISNRHAIAKL